MTRVLVLFPLVILAACSGREGSFSYQDCSAGPGMCRTLQLSGAAVDLAPGLVAETDRETLIERLLAEREKMKAAIVDAPAPLAAGPLAKLKKAPAG